MLEIWNVMRKFSFTNLMWTWTLKLPERSTWCRDSRACKDGRKRKRRCRRKFKTKKQSKDGKELEKKLRKIRAKGPRSWQVSLIKVEAELRTWENLVQHFLSSEPRSHWTSWWIRWLTGSKFLLEANGNGLEVQQSRGSTFLFKDKGLKWAQPELGEEVSVTGCL